MSKTVYVDACVIIALLRKEHARANIIDACFTATANNSSDVRFITSTVTMVEVAHLARKSESIDPNHFRAIDEFWKTSPVKVVELNRHAAVEGRTTMQNRLLQSSQAQLPEVRKRVHDLAHIGTALWLKADEFWTYDPDFSKYPTDRIKVTNPHSPQQLLPGL